MYIAFEDVRAQENARLRPRGQIANLPHKELAAAVYCGIA